MSLMPTARRAEEFALLLERGGRTDDPVVAPMVALTSMLQAAAPAAVPAPEFRAALRQRLVAVATVQGVGAPAETRTHRLLEAGTSWRVRRRLVAAAGGVAVVTAVAGVGVGASRSLPGDAFYALKRATEDVQLAATSGQEAKGKRHLEFAATRLDEVRALAGDTSALGPSGGAGPTAAGSQDNGTAALILSTLSDMDDETRAGANDLFAVFRDSGSPEPLQALNEFTRRQYSELRTVLGALPPDVRDRARSSLSLLVTVSTDTSTLVGRCPPSGCVPATGTPTPTSTSVPTTPSTGPTTTTPTTTGEPTTTGGPTSGPTTTPPTSTKPTTTGPAPVPTSTAVPTIPSLPTVVPVPTEPLPTELPTLPPVPTVTSLPLLP